MSLHVSVRVSACPALQSRCLLQDGTFPCACACTCVHAHTDNVLACRLLHSGLRLLPHAGRLPGALLAVPLPVAHLLLLWLLGPVLLPRQAACLSHLPPQGTRQAECARSRSCRQQAGRERLVMTPGALPVDGRLGLPAGCSK